MERRVKTYEVKLKLVTDVTLNELQDLKFWEDQSHSDCSPFFLVTEIDKVEEGDEVEGY